MKPPIDPISQELYLALMAIPPSGDDYLEYHPVSLQLKDGTFVDRAYLMPMATYLRWWGPDWEGRSYIPIRDVSRIAECPSRLPQKFANKLYAAGESGMGYCIFTIDFADGTSCVFVTGNAVDFLDYPRGKSGKDVVDVKPHQGRNEWQAGNYRGGADYQWVLFEGVAS
jgi:hypothetical protein